MYAEIAVWTFWQFLQIRDDAFAEGLEYIADLFENMHVEFF